MEIPPEYRRSAASEFAGMGALFLFCGCLGTGTMAAPAAIWYLIDLTFGTTTLSLPIVFGMLVFGAVAAMAVLLVAILKMPLDDGIG